VASNDYLRQTNALIRHFFPGVDPDQLNDEQWSVMAKDAEWLIKILNQKE
jgi:hypothetical protein